MKQFSLPRNEVRMYWGVNWRSDPKDPLRGRSLFEIISGQKKQKGYVVHGIIRRASTFNTKRIDHLYKDPHNKNLCLSCEMFTQ